MGGLCLGYIYYPEISLQESTNAHDDGPKTRPRRKTLLDEPTLSALLITAAGTMVLLVMLAMITIVFKNNILHGLSTIEIERARRWKGSPRDPGLKLWVPLSASVGQPRGKVVVVPHGLPIFDLGPRLNFQLIMGEKVWHWFGKSSSPHLVHPSVHTNTHHYWLQLPVVSLIYHSTTPLQVHLLVSLT
jgi:hypothetical protein